MATGSGLGARLGFGCFVLLFFGFLKHDLSIATLPYLSQFLYQETGKNNRTGGCQNAKFILCYPKPLRPIRPLATGTQRVYKAITYMGLQKIQRLYTGVDPI